MQQTQTVKLQAEISATSKGLVDALNRASGAVNDASQNWKSRFATLRDSTSLVSQSVKNLSDLISNVGDIDMSVEGLDKVKSSIASVSDNFTRVKGEIDAFAQSLVEMRNAASDLDMPVEEYQQFADAVANSGVKMEDAMAMLKQ